MFILQDKIRRESRLKMKNPIEGFDEGEIPTNPNTEQEQKK
jgi:hypothetical protein